MHSTPTYKIIIAGGGTGGHIFPALAIAAALQAAGPVELLFVGAQGKMEMKKVPEAGYRIEGLPIAGFNRAQLWANWKLPFLLLKSMLKVRSIMAGFKPDAVVGVGGYSSYPVLRYAQWLGIPTFLHESNSFAGKANQMLGKKAVAIFAGTKGLEAFFKPEKLVITGNPVRKGLQPGADGQQARAAFGFGQPQRFTLLSVGGSLGARSINETWASHLPALAAAGINLIWQTGSLGYEAYRQHHAPEAGIVVTEFINDMNGAYAAAHAVVSRAGAMAVAELCLLQKPAVLVPYPHAAEDHQTANARLLASAGAALLVPDAELASGLMPAVIELAQNTSLRSHMALKMKPFAHPQAAEHIAQSILHHIQNRS